jgi:hypothetical protein
MSETPDGEVDYRSSGSIANPLTDSDHAWSTSEIEKNVISEIDG